MEIKDLQTRITKKEEQIKKIEKRISKWESSKDSEKEFVKKYGWLNTFEERKEYYKNQFLEYCERELSCAKRDLEEANKTLIKYQNMLEVENQKANSIEQLPEMFKEFMNSLINSWDLFDIMRRDEIKEEVKAIDKLPYGEWRKEEQKLIRKYGYSYREKANETDNQIHQQNIKDAKEVILDLINRVSCVTGEIIDFSGLYLARNNEGYTILNGVVVGKNGKALVESILAGGYNIQRLHIRVLVKNIK